MAAPEGPLLRKGIVAAGAILLVAGVIVFLACAVGLSQATATFMGCTNGTPTGPTFGFPTACTDAMGAMVLYGTLEWIGIIVGVVGFILLILGLMLEPERPAYAPPSYYYPPPAYGPPPSYAPPQGPQTPPPQP